MQLQFREWFFLQELLIESLEEGRRQSNRYRGYKSRVRYGRGIEKKVLEALKKQDWEIDPASASEDMHDKIDGWVLKAESNVPILSRTPLQIKYRDTGDDILMEVIKQWTPTMMTDPSWTGRDMRGKAELYAVLNKAGTCIRVRKVSEARGIAKNLASRLIETYPKQKCLSEGRSQVRFTVDPHTKQPKVNAYLDPDSFDWQVNYSVKGIW